LADYQFQQKFGDQSTARSPKKKKKVRELLKIVRELFIINFSTFYRKVFTSDFV